jgi:hypothetical protein
MADAAGQVAQLRQVLELVEEIAGHPPRPHDRALDDAARLSGAYAAALPIVQRRFDTLASETARWAAAGVETLITLQDRGRPCAPAAARLALELARALTRLAQIVVG